MANVFTNDPSSLLAVIINIGGGEDGAYIGFKYWHNPGAFNNGFKGLCSSFVTAAFAYGGTELVGLAAAETANPRKSLPTAVKQVRFALSYSVDILTDLPTRFSGASRCFIWFLSSWSAF